MRWPMLRQEEKVRCVSRSPVLRELSQRVRVVLIEERRRFRHVKHRPTQRV